MAQSSSRRGTFAAAAAAIRLAVALETTLYQRHVMSCILLNSVKTHRIQYLKVCEDER